AVARRSHTARPRRRGGSAAAGALGDDGRRRGQWRRAAAGRAAAGQPEAQQPGRRRARHARASARALVLTRDAGFGARARARGRRFWLLGASVTGVSAAVLLFLNAMGDSMMFYLTPTQVLERTPPMPPTKRFRLGGIVREGSVAAQAGSPVTSFTITD